jgi:Transglycosylase SLT domain/LysM domain
VTSILGGISVTDTPPASVDPGALVPPVVPEPTRRHHPRVLLAAGITTVVALGALFFVEVGSDQGSAGGGGSAQFAVSRYHVRPGDTISSVAALHAQDVDDLLEAWDLTLADSLEPGSELEIPPLPTDGHAWPQALADDPVRASLDGWFRHWADEEGVPVALVEAVAWVESRWNLSSVTDDGDLGIGHLDPEVVGWLNREIMEDPIDPRSTEGNIQLTTTYLAHLLDVTDGDHAAALVAYYRDSTGAYDSSWDLDVVGFVARVMAMVPDFEATPAPSATPPASATTAPTTTRSSTRN